MTYEMAVRIAKRVRGIPDEHLTDEQAALVTLLDLVASEEAH